MAVASCLEDRHVKFVRGDAECDGELELRELAHEEFEITAYIGGEQVGKLRGRVDSEDVYIARVDNNTLTATEKVKGVGRSLVEAAIDLSREKGLGGRVSLQSEPHVVGFYQMLGFTYSSKTILVPRYPEVGGITTALMLAGISASTPIEAVAKVDDPSIEKAKAILTKELKREVTDRDFIEHWFWEEEPTEEVPIQEQVAELKAAGYNTGIEMIYHS